MPELQAMSAMAGFEAVLIYLRHGRTSHRSMEQEGGTMANIKTKLNVGDTVWWVHCSNKIYKGTVEILYCDYQGHCTANLCLRLLGGIRIRPCIILTFSSPRTQKNLQVSKKQTLTMCPRVYGMPLCVQGGWQ